MIQLAAALLLTLLPAPTLSAQSAEPVFKVNTRIVILDVVVTDKKGNLVTDLKQSDFTVLEDDQPQVIKSFEAPSAHDLPPAPDGKPVVTSAADLPRIGNAPVTVLVLDELNTPFNDMSFARSSLKSYLDKQPAVLKQPTIFLVQNSKQFVMLHDFTQDRDALLKALKYHQPMYPYKAQDTGSSLPNYDPHQSREREAQTMQALNQIAEAMRGIPGRKNVIWVGRNLPSICLHDCLNEWGGGGTDPNTLISVQLLTRHMTQILLQGRVTLYIINPLNTEQTAFDGREVYNPKDPFGGQRANFNYLAPITGGLELRQGNDVDAKLKTAEDESTAYYTLSYSPTNHSEDPAQYRNIVIQVANHPELTINTRGGYYADAPNTTDVAGPPALAEANLQRNLLFEILQASISPLTYTGLSITVQKGATPGTWKVAVDPQALSWTSQAGGVMQAEMTTTTVALDAKSELLAHASHEEVSDRKADMTRSAPVNYEATLAVPAKATRIRFIVRDAVSGRIGTADVTP
jgi:VWFA-related protein